jgi:DNA-directed RNA polymerase specialized sigma24 family protein
VTDLDRPLADRVVDALKTGNTEKLLRTYARWLTNQEADGEDLFNEMMRLVCDPDARPWSEDRGGFSAHARMVMRDAWKKHRRSAATRLEVLQEVASIDESTRSPDVLPDEALHEARQRAREARLGALLRARLETRPLALKVLEHRAQGMEDYDEIARLCGSTVSEVYEANRQFTRAAQAILEEDNRAEARRMMGLRARFRRALSRLGGRRWLRES